MNLPEVVVSGGVGGRAREAAGEGEGADPGAGRAGRRAPPHAEVAVEKDYDFEGPDGKASLLDLFEGRRQLIVYRFFFEPGVAGWPEGAAAAVPSSPTRSPTSPT